MTTTNEAGENFQEKERAGRTAEDAMRATLTRVLRERDEARRDFVRVADALGCVSTDDTGRAGALASVEEVVEQARKAQKCFDLWEDVHAASFMACENPPTGCDCAGCSYAREKGGAV